ncbi:MAG: DUF4012 domain-containing protein [Egibacteraceae bacterium]
MTSGTTALEASAPSSADGPGSRSRRWRALGILLGLAALLAWGALAAISLLTARTELTAARGLADDGRSALLEADTATAQRDFGAAAEAFARADQRLSGPAMLPLRAIPVVRANLLAANALAAAGALTATAGEEVAGSVVDLPGGLQALVPRGGTVPLEPIARLAPALNRADALLGEAGLLTESMPSRGLVGPLADARAQFLATLDHAATAVRTASTLTDVLPTFLGADAPKRYFFGAGNPAELRGAGGFIGAYAILTVDEGRIDIGPFSPIQDLGAVPAEDATAPNADYADRYNRFGGAGFWLNINMTPDFPSAAEAIESLYLQATGEAMDGTIVAEPATLAALLAVTGPVDVPGFDATVDADNVVAFVANEAFDRITDPEQRKRLLGAVAASALQGFLQGGEAQNSIQAIAALSSAVNGRHLLLHSGDDAVQNAFAETGVAGRLLDPDGDYLAAVVNNAANNKADYYAERTVHYQVALRPQGGAAATAAVELANATPTEGVTGYVIGPNVADAEPGDNRSLLSVYCAAGCERTAFRRSRNEGSVREETELAHPVFTTMVPLGSGEAERIELDWTVDDVWTVDGDQGAYRLTVQDQPTVRPTRLVVDVLVPEGMTVTGASEGFEVEGGHARWDGKAPATAALEVRFAPTDQPSTWERVRRFLNRPVFPG